VSFTLQRRGLASPWRDVYILLAVGALQAWLTLLHTAAAHTGRVGTAGYASVLLALSIVQRVWIAVLSVSNWLRARFGANTRDAPSRHVAVAGAAVALVFVIACVASLRQSRVDIRGLGSPLLYPGVAKPAMALTLLSLITSLAFTYLRMDKVRTIRPA
jgi:hypothetical protein